MDTLFQDIRYGSRQLRKSPAFTIAAVLTLALGIGANATVFTWLNSVIFSPLPRVDSSDLLYLRWRTPQGNAISLSWPDFVDYRARNHSFQGMIAGRMAALSLGNGDQPERIWGMLVSANYFDTLGVKAWKGRTFLPEEDQNPGGHPVAVISYDLWQSRFAGDPNAIGRTIRLNQQNFTVVGITPEGFQGSTLGLQFQIWAPAIMQQTLLRGSGVLDQRGSHWLEGWGRLKPGVTARQAEADLNSISKALAQEFYQSDRFSHSITTPVWKEGGGRVLAPLMLLMMGVVGIVLLIACANISNLLLARSAGRRREVAIRLALGVRRGRLIRQLLIENSLLAVFGCAAAMAVVPAASGLLQTFVPPSDLPIGLASSAGSRVFLFALGVSVLATLLFGLVPAIRASRPDVVEALKDDGGGSAGQRRSWLRNSLVVAQVSLSLVLLIAAGLLLKSLNRARSADPGFDARNVLVAGVDLAPNGYDTARGRVALQQMTTRIAALPGVSAVSTTRRLPLGLGGTSSTSFEVEGYVPAPHEELVTYTHFIGPDYFHTMNTPLIAGREFMPNDSAKTQNVIVVNQTFAKRYLSSGDPIGRRVRLVREWWVVAGVVKDSKFQSLDQTPTPSVYYPVSQFFASEATFVVRANADPLALARPLEDAIHSVDPALPVFGTRSLEASIGVAYFGQRMGGSLLAFFGTLAMALAGVGIYGVLAYAVTQRSRELGIRMALGASRADVLGLILRQGLTFAGIGIALGLGIALATTRLMRTLLFGVSPTDVVTMAGVTGILLAVILAASYLPAQRATRIDPIRAIRYE